MALPRNVKLQITYDGTASETVSVTTASAGAASSYTVKSGDTLWAISKRYYGSGTQYPKIYNANADLIESTAKAHGKKSSSNGHWIWPGEVLTIPEAQRRVCVKQDLPIRVWEILSGIQRRILPIRTLPVENLTVHPLQCMT